MRSSPNRSSLVLLLAAITPTCEFPVEVESQVVDPAMPVPPQYSLQFKLIRGFSSPYPIPR